MATDDERDQRPHNGLMDYKTAFYGACGLITVFAGLSWRLFSADLTDSDRARAVIDQDQSVAIRALERQLDSTTREVAICHKDTTDLEARVRYLEHKNDRR